MKKLRLSILALSLLTISTLSATEVTVSMGANYANQVYYKLGSDSATVIPANAWDVMFLRTSSRSFATRINDGRNIVVYEVLNNYTSAVTQAQWDNVAVDILSQTSWTELNNSDTVWSMGAFEQVETPAGNQFAYGWGYYDMTTHQLFASAIFILKYPDNTYIKFKIDNYAAGYTISYATWDNVSSTWGTTATATILNTTGTGSSYNFFSFATNSVVASIPTDDQWDFVFTQYRADMGTMFYRVTGVLQGYNTSVAKKTDGTQPTEDDFSSYMNTIGYDWKTHTGGGVYQVEPNTRFFLRSADGNEYELWFTDFAGASTGNISFEYEQIIESSNEVATNSANLTLYYSNNEKTLQIGNAAFPTMVEIYTITGQRVMSGTTTNSQFDVSSLNKGIYVAHITSGNSTVAQKFIIQ